MDFGELSQESGDFPDFLLVEVAIELSAGEWRLAVL
jgi:hypothetical protein